MTVVVVTDSSARLPAGDLESFDIRQVPLHVLAGGENFRDGVDAIAPDIHEKPDVTTAGAAPAELADAYRDALAASGGDGVVAVHLSSALSSTMIAAEQAAREFDGAVRVVDSRSAAMGTGFVALAAAEAAGAGCDLDAVVAEAVSCIPQVCAHIVVHRLDNLRRSGRIGTAASWLSTALAIKPVLRVDDGRLVLAQRVRTATKALAAMVDQVAEVVGDAPARLAVHHVDNEQSAADVAAALAERFPNAEPATVSELGPVLAVHVGTGAIAVCACVRAPRDR